MTGKTWTAAEVVALGVRTDAETAGSILGLCRTETYERIKDGSFPVPTFRVGRRVVVPVAPILELLGLDAAPAGDGQPAPALRVVGG